jgi:DNA phosphorothioation-dependent restriction protein DptG
MDRRGFLVGGTFAVSETWKSAPERALPLFYLLDRERVSQNPQASKE